MRMIAVEEPGSVTLFVSPSRKVACVAGRRLFFCCYFLIERARVCTNFLPVLATKNN